MLLNFPENQRRWIHRPNTMDFRPWASDGPFKAKIRLPCRKMAWAIIHEQNSTANWLVMILKPLQACIMDIANNKGRFMQLWIFVMRYSDRVIFLSEVNKNWGVNYSHRNPGRTIPVLSSKAELLQLILKRSRKSNTFQHCQFTASYCCLQESFDIS